MATRIATAGLLLVTLFMLGVSAWVVATGGADTLILGHRLSVRSGSRPFFVAGLAMTVVLLIAPAWQSRVDRLIDRLTAAPRAAFLAIALLIAAGVFTIGIHNGSFVAAAADSYGYVTQAELWRQGRVPRIEQPQYQSLPWPNGQYTFAPLGYRPSLDGRAIVPTYPPGYPLLMAATMMVFGQGAEYCVVPALAAVTIVGIFLLGRQIANDWIGLMAAIWLGMSPAFLFHTVLPMSDVPATAGWTLALLLVMRPTLIRAIAGGICCGIAVLIRPQLAPLAALLAVMMFRTTPRRWIRDAAAFSLALLPFALSLAWLNRHLYGSPFTSGYGDLSAMFSLGYFPTNLRHYVYWFWETQTIAIFLAPLAVWTARSPEARTDRAQLLLFATGVGLIYACYLPFDSWDFLRFLLPAFPALLILTACVLIDLLLTRWSRAIGVVALVTLTGMIALASEREAVAKGVFDSWRSLRRYVDVATYARTKLPPRAVYLTQLYSGTLRYYGNLPTLRWDVLDPEWLDKAIAHLHEQGYAPIIVIEQGDEDHDFRERFHTQRFGKLDWPPAGEYRGLEVVRFYDPLAQ